MSKVPSLNKKAENHILNRRVLFLAAFTNLLLGCVFSFTSSSIPIVRKIYRHSIAIFPLPLELGLVQVAFFFGNISGQTFSIFLPSITYRKYFLFSALIFTCVVIILFGLCKDFYLICLFRFLLGTLFGIIIDSLNLLYPLQDDLYRISVYLFVIIGISVGPLIGILTDLKFKFLDDNTELLFAQFPLLLPSIVIAFFIFSISLSVLFIIQSEKTSRKFSISKGSSGVTYKRLDSGDEDEYGETKASRNQHLDNTLHGNEETVESSAISMIETAPDLTLLSPINSLKDYEDVNNFSDNLNDSVCSIDNSIFEDKIENLKTKKRQAKSRVVFSTMVTVKVIGSPNLEYENLKHLHKNENPIQIDNNGFNVSNEFPIYGNGSELYGEEEVYNQSISKNISKLLTKDTILICLVIIGLVGIIVMYSIQLSQINILNSQIFDDYMNLFALSECICGVISFLVTGFFYLFYFKKWGSLFVFYRTVNIFSFVALLLLIAPFTFDYISEFIYYSIQIILTSVICTCSSIIILIGLNFLNNSCYNHEKRIVIRSGFVLFNLGLLSGSYLAVSLFSLSEWLKGYLNERFQISWIFPLIITRLLLLLLKKLPKKIQRRMREPVKPRYAVSMQIHFDQFGFSDKYENDEDSILDQMENSNQ